jgi:hypothetical protein
MRLTAAVSKASGLWSCAWCALTESASVRRVPPLPVVQQHRCLGACGPPGCRAAARPPRGSLEDVRGEMAGAFPSGGIPQVLQMHQAVGVEDRPNDRAVVRREHLRCGVREAYVHVLRCQVQQATLRQLSRTAKSENPPAVSGIGGCLAAAQGSPCQGMMCSWRCPHTSWLRARS